MVDVVGSCVVGVDFGVLGIEDGVVFGDCG